MAGSCGSPSSLGYVLAGVLNWSIHARPYGYCTSTRSNSLLRIGVILLMFSVGLEFSIKELLPGQVGLRSLAARWGSCCQWAQACFSGRLLGWTPPKESWSESVISVASTMVLTRLLLDAGS